MTTITITNRWGKETKDPEKSFLDSTLNDLFIDSVLSDVSITDGKFHLDINNDKWVYLESTSQIYYMKNLEIKKIRQLWEWFYMGNIDYVLAEPWIIGVPAFNDNL